MLILEVTKASTGERTEFTLEENLSEITLGRFVQFKNKIDFKKPESLQQFEEADEAQRLELMKKMDQSLFVNEWRDFMLDVARFWTQLPEDYLAELTEEEVIFVYHLINRHVFTFQYDENKTGFQLDGETYHYPPAAINPFSTQRDYMKGTRVIDSIEAMQFEMYYRQLGESRWAVLPHVAAILCKKEGEQLPLKSSEREQWIADRAKLFEQLPMDEALNIAFFLITQNRISSNVSKLYSTLNALGLRNPVEINFGKNTVEPPASKKWLTRAFSAVQGLPHLKLHNLQNAMKSLIG